MDVFKIVTDSQKMDCWNDSLGMMVNSVGKRYGCNALSDEELSMVAGGVKKTEIKPDDKQLTYKKGAIYT